MMRNRDRRNSVCHYSQERIECYVVSLVCSASLNAQNHKAEIRWRDARVVQTIVNCSRRPRAVNAVTLETRQTLLLDGNENLVAAQQTRRAVVRSADP